LIYLETVLQKRKGNLMRFAKKMVHLPYLAAAAAGSKICFESV
jgi:hypothetical protein